MTVGFSKVRFNWWCCKALSIDENKQKITNGSIEKFAKDYNYEQTDLAVSEPKIRCKIL